jgi:hypothetical protein
LERHRPGRRAGARSVKRAPRAYNYWACTVVMERTSLQTPIWSLSGRTYDEIQIKACRRFPSGFGATGVVFSGRSGPPRPCTCLEACIQRRKSGENEHCAPSPRHAKHLEGVREAHRRCSAAKRVLLEYGTPKTAGTAICCAQSKAKKYPESLRGCAPSRAKKCSWSALPILFAYRLTP